MGIIKENKLLASFMGANFKSDIELWLPIFGICRFDTVELGKGKTLRYHISWDWLMPVVEKIESLLPDDSVVIIESKDCTIPVIQDGFDIYVQGTYKHESVYLACVEFIKWYNKQQIIKLEK